MRHLPTRSAIKYLRIKVLQLLSAHSTRGELSNQSAYLKLVSLNFQLKLFAIKLRLSVVCPNEFTRNKVGRLHFIITFYLW